MESSFHLQSANVGKFLTYQKQNDFVNRHRYLFCCLALLSIAIGQLGCGKLRVVATSNEAGIISGASPVHLTDRNFQREVLESVKPVLVDMWAPWCQPCIVMKPTLRRVASELAGHVRVAELNIDENLFIKEKYEIDRYPVLLLFVNGVEVKRLYGLKSKDELLDALRTVISGQHEVTAIKNPNNGRTIEK